MGERKHLLKSQGAWVERFAKRGNSEEIFRENVERRV
ncbi:uncharacterized protein G2W53_027682 [Senna tora]|uniref:Uncharacterized protein n=1 Tax=Senna tora TaxID=362788 RepID=A0A834TJ43_9FABA|nr:uncharacterized protein G2W53_027682 [Senna tora]